MINNINQEERKKINEYRRNSRAPHATMGEARHHNVRIAFARIPQTYRSVSSPFQCRADAVDLSVLRHYIGRA